MTDFRTPTGGAGLAEPVTLLRPSRHHDEAELLERFRSGDPTAMPAIYRAYRRSVFTVARSITGDPQLADEVVQETFVKAWQAADRFETGRALAPWLHTIARRAAIDALRHERRPTTGGHEAEVEVGQAGPSFERTWIVHQVRAAIDELPACEREIVRLSHLAGLSHREIAARLDLPIGTVKSRSSRAHRRLAARLQPLRDHTEHGEPIIASAA